MAKIFISYSRVDLAFVEQLYRRLQQMRPTATIWYDKAPHGLLGGDNWWNTILDAIAASDWGEQGQAFGCPPRFAVANVLMRWWLERG